MQHDKPTILRWWLLIIPFLYWSTKAYLPVVGDPTEYTFVAHVLGVAHPPGYAFITLVGKLFQEFAFFGGQISGRMHLVAVTAGTIGTIAVYGTITALGDHLGRPRIGRYTALFTALAVGTATNYWQHSIHTNPHIITATFLAINLFTLTRWYVEFSATEQPTRANRWLYFFCLNAGLGVTHHPLTTFALPACVVFVLLVYPRILSNWQTLLRGTGMVLLGTLVFAYFPLRAPDLVDTQFVSDMNTVEGFLNLILARGLRVNLFHFGPSDQWDRFTVFWTLLRLQYMLPVIGLAIWGARTVWTEAKLRPIAIFYTLAFFLNYLFVINTVQDVMAYLLGPFVVVGLFIGIGLLDVATRIKNNQLDKRIALGLIALILLTAPVWTSGPLAARIFPDLSAVAFESTFMLLRFASWRIFLIVIGTILLVMQLWRWRKLRPFTPAMFVLDVLVILGLLWPMAWNRSRISLEGYRESRLYTVELRDHFADQDQNAALLNDWEHMTPIWYEELVGEWSFGRPNVRPIFVSAAKPWLEHVFEELPAGPVYLSRFERSIFDAGFRLRQRGNLTQVVEPGEASIPPEIHLLTEPREVVLALGEPTKTHTPGPIVLGEMEIVGYAIKQSPSESNDWINLALALRVNEPTADVYMPSVRMQGPDGPIEYIFTTDSHLLTTDYIPGEIIVESFGFALPPEPLDKFTWLELGLVNLSQGEHSSYTKVTTHWEHRNETVGRNAIYDNLLANYRQRVGLASAGARRGLTNIRNAPWQEPISARNGDTIHLTLDWRVLKSPEDSYTIFVHLIDLANRPVIDNLDYTPLGGATPSHLWFPKWLPGQSMRDPYQMKIENVPPGDYLIEVGLYEQFTKRRLHMHDKTGNIIGDRYILGSVRIEP